MNEAYIEAIKEYVFPRSESALIAASIEAVKGDGDPTGKRVR
jgi:hypothetical protein